MMYKVNLVVLVGIVALASGDIRPHALHHPVVPVHHAVPVHRAVPLHKGYEPVYPDTIPHYKFEYAVHDDYSGNHFGHAESRDGYKTEGKYFVQLPDGRLQTVTYLADETGYHPIVTYEGTAHAHPAPAPAYHVPVVPKYHA